MKWRLTTEVIQALLAAGEALAEEHLEADQCDCGPYNMCDTYKAWLAAVDAIDEV